MASENEEEQIQKLKRLLARASNHIDDITTQLNNAKTDIINLKKENDELRKQNLEVGQQVEELKASSAQYEINNIDRLKSTQEINEKIADYENQIKTSAFNSQALSSEIHEKGKQISSIKRELESVTQKNTLLTEELENLRNSNIQLEKNLQQKGDTIESAKKTEENYLAETKRLSQLTELLNKEKLDLEEDYKKYKVKVNALLQKSSEKSEPKHNEEPDISVKLKEKLNELRDSNKAMQEQIKNLSHLQHQSEHDKTMCDVLKKEKHALSTKLEQMKQQESSYIEENKKTVSSLQEELENVKIAHETSINDLKQSLECEFEKINSSTIEKMHRLKEHLTVKEEIIKNMQDELEILRTEKSFSRQDQNNTATDESVPIITKNIEDSQLESIDKLANMQSKYEYKLHMLEQELLSLRQSLKDTENMNNLLLSQERILKEELRKSENSGKLAEVKESNLDVLRSVIIKHLETGETESLLPVLAELLKLTQTEVKNIKESIEKRKTSNNEGIATSLWKVFGSP